MNGWIETMDEEMKWGVDFFFIIITTSFIMMVLITNERHIVTHLSYMLHVGTSWVRT